MAQGLKLDPQDADGVWIESGKDHGKPVSYQIRPIPLDVERRLHRKVYGDAKARKIGRESAATVVERIQEYTLLRAAYALVDTRNFSLGLGDAERAAVYAKQTGGTVQFDSEVLLDGKWTDELRADVLRIVRNRAQWIVYRAGLLTEKEVEDEEEEAEDF